MSSLVGRALYAALSHGLASSPPQGEGRATLLFVHQEIRTSPGYLSPRTWRRRIIRASLACDGRGSIRLHVAATGAWKESLTEGSRSRRPGLTGNGEAPAMAGSRCPPSVAQGAIARLR